MAKLLTLQLAITGPEEIKAGKTGRLGITLWKMRVNWDEADEQA